MAMYTQVIRNWLLAIPDAERQILYDLRFYELS